MDFLSEPQLKIVFQLLSAAFLGGLVGLEREYHRKGAGLRTYILVTVGAALFTIIALNAFVDNPIVDPSRIISQIVLGVGFLGAGLIIYRDAHIEGLTTAAGLWVVAGIGMAVGTELYFLAFFVCLMVAGILIGLRLFEKKVFKTKTEG
ncbi:MAG: MgtC/SapB family protein [Candidatus Parcubacteria bacterium]|nr:MgtC/SapB family protein [Candidatus Parcubacteria bacterium]